jgi:transposase
VERVEAEAIYDAERDAVVEVLLALSAQNERLQGQVERLTARVDKLERELAKDSRNSSRPPSVDPPGAAPRRGKDSSGRSPGCSTGPSGRGSGAVADVGGG